MKHTLTLLKAVISIAIGRIVYALGGADILLQVILFVIVADYISGVLKAFVKGELSSKVGFKGIAKKIGIFIVVALAVQLERLLGPELAIREITITFYIVNEGLSILENLGEFIKVPSFLKGRLSSLSGEKDNDPQD